jgi:hypothetical protein
VPAVARQQVGQEERAAALTCPGLPEKEPSPVPGTTGLPRNIPTRYIPSPWPHLCSGLVSGVLVAPRRMAPG